MRLSDVAELLLLAALWGGSFLFMRVAAPVLGPVWLIEIRVLTAGLVLLPVCLRLSKRSENEWAKVRARLWPLFLVGVVNSALPFLLLAFASISLPAGFTSILNGTTPLFGMVVAAIWFQEKLTAARLFGLALGFVGVVVLIGWQTLAMTPGVMAAIAAGLFAAVMYAIAAPYAKRQLAGLSPIAITTLSQLGAALAILPLLPFTVPAQMPSGNIILAAVALALFSTSLAYILYFRLIQNIGSTRALTVTYLIPAFAMLWGAIALGEPITAAMVVGCGFVLMGTATANGLFTGRQS
ncbi:MAG: DMT family transporter [Cyanobacteria bacterium J06614_10]